MIWEPQAPWLFVKTRKAAGSSIEAWLEGACPGAVVTPRTPAPDDHQPRGHVGFFVPRRSGQLRTTLAAIPDAVRGRRFYNHMSAAAARARLGAAWDRAFRWCFDRNPWQQAVSQFCYQTGATTPNEAAFRAWLAGPEYRPNHTLYMHADRPLVHWIGRFEHLAEDTTAIAARLGLDPPALRHEKAARPRADYHAWYDDGSRRLVADRCAPSIRLLGYTFDSTPGAPWGGT